MDKNAIKGLWKQIRGDVQRRWSKLTDDDLGRIEGDRVKLIGALQERYGRSREQAAEDVDRFFDDLATKVRSPK